MCHTNSPALAIALPLGYIYRVTGLALGPLLRYVDHTSAAVWMETAGRGEVSVRLHDPTGASTREVSDRTFTVHGHHYALVDITGLEPGSSVTYTVHIDGEQVWPAADSRQPPSRIRTLGFERRHRIVFGSCRTSVPHDAQHNRSHGADVLRAFALRLMEASEDDWPSLVMLLGDQVYADETSDAMREFIASRRDIEQPPKEELKDFTEYAHLYRLAWTDPANRWLLSTLPTAMIFDDHDIRDDWNTSAEWREQMRRLPWWHDRIVGGLASYWVYQHVGNLSAADRAADEAYNRVREIGAHGDAGDYLDEVAEKADEQPNGMRWSYTRDLGGSRLVVLDSRAGRVLDEGERKMLDDREMAWFESLVQGGVDHLIVGSGLPFLLPMGLHHLEAWNEAVTNGAWGERAARWGEKVRQGVDLEHWAAFEGSFQRVARAVADLALGRRGEPPATVLFLGGDVHHSYLAEAKLPDSAPRGRLLQAVCSPIRNPLPRVVRFATASASYGLAWPMGRLVASSAKVSHPPFRWHITDGPWFANSLATLDIDGRKASIVWETADTDGDADPVVRTVHRVTVS